MTTQTLSKWFLSRRVWISVALAACIVGVATPIVFKHQFTPRKWAEVEKGRLFRSGQLDAELVERTLRENGIRVVVDLTKQVPGRVAQDAEAKAIATLGIEAHRFPLRGDGTGDIENYAGALDAICDAMSSGKRCLVHCTAGTERTGAAVAFYRILVQGRTRDAAVSEMIAAGMDPKRNTALLPYLDANLPVLRRLLLERSAHKSETTKQFASLPP